MTAAFPPPHNNGAARPRSDGALKLVVLGYITAVAMPPIGAVLGIVIAVRVRKRLSRHGVWIIALSVIASVLWVLVLTSGALSVSETNY